MPSTCTDDKTEITVSKIFQYCSIMLVIMLHSPFFRYRNLIAVKWPR